MRIGRWWHRGREIDIVAIGEKDVLFMEVKWKRIKGAEVERLIKKLREKAESININLENYRVHYGVFAREVKEKPEKGFVIDLKTLSRLR